MRVTGCLVDGLHFEGLASGRFPNLGGDGLVVSIAIQNLVAGNGKVAVRSVGLSRSIQRSGTFRNGIALIDQSERACIVFLTNVDSHILGLRSIVSLLADIKLVVLNGENRAYGFADALDLDRTSAGDLVIHKGKGLNGICIRAGAFRILTPPDGVGVVAAFRIRIRIEGAAVKGHIRAGCPHPAAQGKRIPTPV